jgi:hypothetical protein
MGLLSEMMATLECSRLGHKGRAKPFCAEGIPAFPAEDLTTFKKLKRAGCWWFTPAIFATQETDMRRIMF